MVVDNSLVTRHTNSESNHHKSNLRDCRECQHTLDIALSTSNSSSIESGEDTDVHNNAHLTRSILNPQWEQAGNLEHTSYNHGSSVDEGADRSRTFHSIWQPDVQWEHSTLTCTTNEHQYQSGRDDEATCSNSLSCIYCDERSCTCCHLEVVYEREAERLCVVTKDEDTNEEEQVGKAGYDKRLLRSCNCCMQRIVETNEQV